MLAIVSLCFVSKENPTNESHCPSSPVFAVGDSARAKGRARAGMAVGCLNRTFSVGGFGVGTLGPDTNSICGVALRIH